MVDTAARRRTVGHPAPGARTGRLGRWRRIGGLPALVTLVLALLPLALVAPMASAATPLNIFVGYMDTHTSGFTSNQPSPWPYTDPTSFVGSPCAGYPNDTTCWDSSALRLDNPGSTDVTGVQPKVVIGTSTYALWGSNVTVKAHSTLVLTETGVQNSTNFDGSDYSPNAYNGGNTASCVNSGAIPAVQIVIAGATTQYLDSGQVLNGGGVDAGHCLNGAFVSGRMDESHPWVQIGSGTANVPTAPQSLGATAGSGSVALSWSAPVSDGGAAITGYNVYRGTSSGGESTIPVATNLSTKSFTDVGLTNGTTYYYTVAAVNTVGTSPQSSQAFATPQLVQATAPAAPTGLVAVGGSNSAGLSWTAPTSTGGSPITGYNVYRGTTVGGESATAMATVATGTSFTDTTLTNGSTYYYKVAAVNAVGTSPSSTEASATPRATAPSAPLTLVASGGNASVALSWAAPTTDGGSGLTGYNVYRGTTVGGESTTALAAGVILTSFTDTTVTNGSTYYYKVVAVNAVGNSPQSNEASATPQQAATVASAPTALTASSGNATAGLSWTAPTSNGGSTITGYNVYRGATAGGESTTAMATNMNATSFNDTTVTNGSTYYYKVVAVNAVGISAQSNEASATPQATAPSAPLALTASSGNATASLSWSVPASTGGSPILSYNVYRGTTAGGESATALAAGVILTSFTDTTVTNGSTYYYKVAAVNAAGISAQSNEASAAPQAAPTAGFVRRVGSATATGSRTTTALAVGAPGVAAGHTLVVSLLLSSTSSTTGAVTMADTAGNVYTVARDVNDGSAGDRTVTLVALGVKALAAGTTITATYPSSAETHFSVDEFAGVTAVDTSAGATASTATFSSGATGTTGQPAEILIGTLGEESGSIPTWAVGWTALPALAISSDYLDTAYRLVTATGAYAATGTTSGQWMAAIITLKTGAPSPTVPAAPAGLVGVGGTTSVGLSWSTPVSDGGSPITGYNLYRGTTVGGESTTALAAGVTLTSFTDTTVTNGSTYYYKVVAVNAVGNSPQSNEASATPQQAATVASAPTALTASSGNATAGLSWTAPTSNGGSTITGYNVYRGATAGGESTTAMATNMNATSFNDTTVTNGSTYYYKVVAVNAVGISAQSNEASATPQATAPSAPLALTASSGNATASLSWSVPASTGGSPILSYNVYRGTTAGGESATALAAGVILTSFTDTTVTNGSTYYYKVAAVNAAGISAQSNEASAAPQAAPTAGFVRRVGSATATGSRTTTALAVGAPGVAAGHTLVVSLLLSSTSSTTGAVTMADTAGNVYTVARDVNDGSAGDRTVTLVALGVKALAAGTTITATYPSSAETHFSVDEFAGVTAVDTSAGATASTAAFSSGATGTTGQPAEILIGTLGEESGKSPTWAVGWTALPALAISSDYLDTAYRLVTATGAYAATGTTSGQWMAAIITLKTG